MYCILAVNRAQNVVSWTPRRQLTRNIIISNINDLSLGRNWSSSLSVMYMSPSMLGVVDISSLSNVTLGVKKTFLNNKASLAFEVSDIFYKRNVTSYTDFIFLKQESRISNDTRRAKLTFSYNIGKTVKKKAVKEKNIEEKSRLGV